MRSTLRLVPLLGLALLASFVECKNFPPGQTLLSCAAGADGKPQACPTGWGCGVDGTCRGASGQFDRLLSPIPAAAWRLELGDFDGDGRKDVVTREPIDKQGYSKLRVHYFDDERTLGKTVNVPVALGYVAVADMTGSGRDALVFGVGSFVTTSGVGVLLGTSDRSFSPVAYPSFSFAAPTMRVFGIDGFVGPERPAFFAVLPNPQTQTSQAILGSPPDLADPKNGIFPLQRVLPAGPERLAGGVDKTVSETSSNEGEMFTAHVFDHPAYPCPEIVFAYAFSKDDSPPLPAVNVITPCKLGPSGIIWDSDTPMVTVGIPAPYFIPPGSAGGVRVVEANGDLFPDLLIGAVDTSATPEMPVTLIAYGNGARQFNSAPDLKGSDKMATEVLRVTVVGSSPLQPPLDESADALTDTSIDGPPILDASVPVDAGGGKLVTLPLPLAAADVNGDGVLDYVGYDAVLVSVKGSSPTVYVEAGSKSAGYWTDAKIADFNRDGTLDIIAGSNAGLDLDFFNGTGTERLNAFTLATNGNTRNFAVADFDGDLFADLAFAQTDVSGDGSDDVAIAYGSASGAPGAPAVIGRFEHVVQVTATPDGNMGIVSVPLKQTTPPQSEVAVLSPSSARVPLAPLSLSAGQQPTTFRHIPIALATGNFTKGSVADVATLGVGRPSPPPPPGSGPNPPDTASARMWLLAADPTQPNPASLKTPTTSHDPLDPTLVPFVPSLQGAPTVDALMAAGDIDQDGLDELVAVMPFGVDNQDAAILIGKSTLGPPDPQHPTAPPAFTFVQVGDKILLGKRVVLETDQVALEDADGDGSLDVLLMIGVPLDSSGVGDSTRDLFVLWNDGKGGFSFDRKAMINTTGENVRGFATVRSDTSGPRALIYLAASPQGTAIRIAHVTQSATSRASIDAKMPLDRTTGIVAGDIDGDGVEDVALAVNGNLVILHGTPVTP